MKNYQIGSGFMADIIDYIYQYGDKSLSEMPFNEIDSLVLSRVSYIPFNGIVSGHVSHKITVLGAFKEFLNRYEDPYSRVLWHDDVPLMAAMAESQRFKKMELCAYKNILDPHREMQFAAITIDMGDGRIFVSFRGTDDTFLGWKEDLNMSFLPVIPSQQEGVEYFNRVCENTKGDIITGGHSKGGTIAIYAVANSKKQNIQRVKAIYCHDSPGFTEDIFEKIQKTGVMNLVYRYVPQSSIVGMLFYNDAKYEIIKSNQMGFMQHDIYSWEIEGKSFKHIKSATKSSMFFDNTIKRWLDNMSFEERRKVIDAVFDVIDKTGAKTIGELTGNWFENSKTILSSFKNMDYKTRSVILASLFTLAKCVKTNITLALSNMQS